MALADGFCEAATAPRPRIHTRTRPAASSRPCQNLLTWGLATRFCGPSASIWRMPMTFRALAALLLMAAPAFAQLPSTTKWPNQKEGDFAIKDFRFKSGETLPSLNIHYTTLGKPKRNAAGDITNAVILLHGTSSSGKAWLMPSLADELFAPGQ